MINKLNTKKGVVTVYYIIHIWNIRERFFIVKTKKYVQYNITILLEMRNHSSEKPE